METITITYDHSNAVQDVNSALATLEALTDDQGLFSLGQEAAEKELGAAYFMSRYERICAVLWSMRTQLSRAYNLLSNEVY